MARLAIPAALVVLGALADARGARAAAFYLLLAAVPAIAAIAVSLYGDLVTVPADAALLRAQTAVWVTTLVALVAATSARAPAVGDAAVPAASAASLFVCLALFVVQGVLAVVGEIQADGRQRGSDRAASRARSISGLTAKNEPTVTARQPATAVESILSGGGEPPAGASWSSSGERMYSARITAR